MLTENPSAHHAHDSEHHDAGANKIFGFWLYLMTDCILFATLFAAFAVSRNQFAGGVTGKDIFELNGVAIETAFLLISSVTYGFVMLAAHRRNQRQVLGWLAVTFLLGAGFVFMEIREFAQLVADGHGPDKSAFLSSFFTLVGTHGLHVTCGLIWMLVLMVQIGPMGKGLTPTYMSRLASLSLFWHFLDIVWICVFTIVYLMGVV